MKQYILAATLVLGAGSAHAAIIEYSLEYIVDEVTYEFRGFGDDAEGVQYEFTFSKTVALAAPMTVGTSFSVNTDYLDWPTDRLSWEGSNSQAIYNIPRGGTSGDITLDQFGIPTDWVIENSYLYFNRSFTAAGAFVASGYYAGYDILDTYDFGVSVDDELTGYGYFETQYTSTRPTEWVVTGLPAPVPLPAAGGLLIAALAGLGLMRRRR